MTSCRPARRTSITITGLICAGLLAGCSGGSATVAPPTAAPAPTASSTANAISSDLVGSGCTGAVGDPASSPAFEIMADRPLITAASTNRQLRRFVAAVSGRLNRGVDLRGTLNGGTYTVFAPTDAAFAKLPAATSRKLAADPGLLARTLTYHVVAARLPSGRLAGKQRTVEGGQLTIARSGSRMSVNGASVVCGGIRTATSNLYLIDTVLTPPAAGE